MAARARSSSACGMMLCAKFFCARAKFASASARAALAPSRSLKSARSEASAPAVFAASCVRSICRRKSPFLTTSPSWTPRLTICPMTWAERSTLRCASIVPFAETLLARSTRSTLATVTSTPFDFFFWMVNPETATMTSTRRIPTISFQRRFIQLSFQRFGRANLPDYTDRRPGGFPPPPGSRNGETRAGGRKEPPAASLPGRRGPPRTFSAFGPGPESPRSLPH